MPADAMAAMLTVAVAAHISLQPSADLSLTEFLLCLAFLVAALLVSMHPDCVVRAQSYLGSLSLDRVSLASRRIIRVASRQVGVVSRNAIVNLRERFADAGAGASPPSAPPTNDASGGDAANTNNNTGGFREVINRTWFPGVDRIIDALHKDNKANKPPSVKQADLTAERFAKSAAPVTDAAALAATQLEYKKIALWFCLLRSSCPDEYTALMAKLGAPPIVYAPADD